MYIEDTSIEISSPSNNPNRPKERTDKMTIITFVAVPNKWAFVLI